jgi:hypothetical protein
MKDIDLTEAKSALARSAARVEVCGIQAPRRRYGGKRRSRHHVPSAIDAQCFEALIFLG